MPRGIVHEDNAVQSQHRTKIPFEPNLKPNVFGTPMKTMLKVDFRRMFTMRLVYIIIGVCFVMPVLILVMTTMMGDGVSVNPQTGVETVMEGFDNVWQAIGSVSGESSAMSMDLTSMCNINMLYFITAVLVCVFVADDFKSGYAKNLFTVRPMKGDYVISKTLVCFVGGALMLIAYFVGAMLGGLIAGLPFALGDNLKQEFGSVFVERNEANFINYHQIDFS